MNLTAALKAYMVEKFGLAATATDDEIKQAIADRIKSGELSAEKLAELLTPKGSSEDAKAKISALIKAEVAEAVKGEVSDIRESLKAIGEKLEKLATPEEKRPTNGIDPVDLATGGGKDGDPQIRVKAASERYNKDTQPLVHHRFGTPVQYMGQQARSTSEATLAKLGVWLRHKMGRRVKALGGTVPDMSEHEKGLLDEVCKGDFYKAVGDFSERWHGPDIKANLLDDATSDGLEIVPIEFDAAIITFPLLYGELFPFVDIVEVTRRRQEGASIANPTVGWGVADGSAITQFDATALVAAIDTVVYPMTFALEMGRDFLADSPVQVAQTILKIMGERFTNEMDNVIANGNGTNRPEGIFTSSSTGSVSSTNGTGGALDIADAENLAFGVAKQYRAMNWNPGYVMNDTTYARFRALKVGSADARRLFGMDYQSYKLNGWPVHIENNISNNDIAFGCLKKYRLYRRQSWTIETTNEGQALRLSNLMLMTGRSRFGGQVVDGNAFAVVSDAPN